MENHSDSPSHLDKLNEVKTLLEKARFDIENTQRELYETLNRVKEFSSLREDRSSFLYANPEMQEPSFANINAEEDLKETIEEEIFEESVEFACEDVASNEEVIEEAEDVSLEVEEQTII